MEFSLAGLSDRLAEAVRAVGPGVVAVEARHRFSASGIIWRPGVVVTADHAIKREEEIGVTLPDGSSVKAELAGRDPGTDLAVLRVAGAQYTREAAPARVEPGALALAVGRSASVGITASLGMVSAVAGAWRTWRGGHIDQYIRLDVALYPGLSGAVVTDAAGRAVGMATSALSRAAGVAVPAATIDRVADQLLTAGRMVRPYLGVGLQPVELPQHLTKKAGVEGRAGLMVLSLESGAPAERGGVLPGDILVGLDGQATGDTDDVQGVLEKHRPGDQVTAVLVRGGERRELSITLAERRAD